jgi:hypothetical protein
MPDYRMTTAQALAHPFITGQLGVGVFPPLGSAASGSYSLGTGLPSSTASSNRLQAHRADEVVERYTVMSYLYLFVIVTNILFGLVSSVL